MCSLLIYLLLQINFMTQLSEPTKKHSLTEIMDNDSGQPIDISKFIRREDRLVIQDRNTMRHRYKSDPKNPWLVCSLCGAAVQLVSFTDRSFYFRHMPEEEDKGCPINTKGRYSADEINAMKYNGAKESKDHKRLKKLLYNSILADPRFENPPKVERVWKGMDRKTWRKPDVQATWLNYRLAFEIQLSTTFLSIIVDRRDFYRSENGYLIWLFKEFNPSKTRRAEEDVFFNNNSNVFIVNERTEEESRENKKLTLECWYALPEIRENQINDVWRHESVIIDDLKFDQQKQRIYFVDYEAERSKAENNIFERKKDVLRMRFIDFWGKNAADHTKISIESWNSIRDDFKGYDILLPENHCLNPFNGVVSIMLSAKLGKPFGYKLHKLIEVTNVAYNYYKNYLYLFGWALRVYGNDDVVNGEDTKNVWKKRCKEIREQMKAHDPAYDRNTDYDQIIFFLLPELTTDSRVDCKKG